MSDDTSDLDPDAEPVALPAPYDSPRYAGRKVKGDDGRYVVWDLELDRRADPPGPPREAPPREQRVLFKPGTEPAPERFEVRKYQDGWGVWDNWESRWLTEEDKRRLDEHEALMEMERGLDGGEAAE